MLSQYPQSAQGLWRVTRGGQQQFATQTLRVHLLGIDPCDGRLQAIAIPFAQVFHEKSGGTAVWLAGNWQVRLIVLSTSGPGCKPLRFTRSCDSKFFQVVVQNTGDRAPNFHLKPDEMPIIPPNHKTLLTYKTSKLVICFKKRLSADPQFGRSQIVNLQAAEGQGMHSLQHLLCSWHLCFPVPHVLLCAPLLPTHDDIHLCWLGNYFSID